MRLLVVHPGASFATADVWAGMVPCLEAQGHKVYHYRLDGRLDFAALFMNYLWKHNGRKPDQKPSASDILYLAGQEILHRALRQQVEWIVVFSGMFLHPDIVVEARRAGQKVAILLSESPYDDERQAAIAGAANIAWTNERISVPLLRTVQPNTFYMRHAFDPARHHPPQEDDVLSFEEASGPPVPRHDVVFVGTGFPERVEALEGVNWEGIDLGIYGAWSLVGSRSRLRKYIRSAEISNDLTAALYRNAKIGLNLHRTSKGFGRKTARIEGAESMNPRDYELAACGKFYISDYRQELEETFGPAVPTFKTPSELEALLRGFLAEGDARRELGRELVRVVAGHTFAARAAQMLDDLARVG